MKANPEHLRTGRKKRESTLPGKGISVAEKMRRERAIKELTTRENADYVHAPSGSDYFLPSLDEGFYRPQQGSLSIASWDLDRMPTSTIVKIDQVYDAKEGGLPLGSIVSTVMEPGGAWMIRFGYAREDAMLDVISYRAHGDLTPQMFEGYGAHTDRTAHAFKEVYRITGMTPGTLPKVGESGRRSFEALVRAVCRNGVFTGRTFVGSSIVNRLLEHGTEMPTFPDHYAKEIIRNPDLADPFIEFSASQGLLAEDVNWNDFMDYARITPSLRDGVL